MTRTRPRIVQHSFGALGTGGPIGALTRVLASGLGQRFDFVHVAQDRPAGGISVGLIRAMARQIREAQPELVHVRGLGNEGFHGVVAARLARAPRVLVSIHGSQADLVHSGGNPLRRGIVARVLEPLTLRLADGIFAVCENGLERPILRPVSRKVLGVVPNGVDVPRPQPAVRERMRETLSIDDDEVVVVIVARVVRDKGHFDLIEALAGIESRSRERVRLLVVGDGPDALATRSAAEGLRRTRVDFLGRRLDVGEILQASDVFVLPSLLEGMSNALLEAMAAGLPVVATSVGGTTEVVAKGGGVLVPPEAPPELAEALLAFIDDAPRRAAAGAEARRVVAENYTLQHMTDRLGEVYDRMLSRS
ncbi:MAG TPA: glycosyltransferase [Sorangium sp.]|nr:glycosyltransferase [Sorangium sp.]